MLKSANVKKYPLKCSHSEPLRSSLASSSLSSRLRFTKFVGTLAAETKNSAMSKRNALLGTASGKLGDTIYYRRKGQQASRTYRASIKKGESYTAKQSRALLRNGINYYNSLATMDLSPLIEVSRYGYINNRIAKENLLRNICIIRTSADEGNAFPFNFVSDILPINSIAVPSVMNDTYSSILIPTLRLGLRVTNNTTPTTIGTLTQWLQTYNPTIKRGDVLAFYASTYPEQFQDIDQSTMPNFAPIPSYREIVLDPESTKTLSEALAGFTIGSYSISSGVYALKFYPDIAKLYSTTGSGQCCAVIAFAMYRRERNGRKKVYFRVGRESSALKELLSLNYVNPYRRKALDSY